MSSSPQPDAHSPSPPPTATFSISLVDLTIVLAIAIVGVVAYKLSPLLLAEADLTINPVSDCDLNRQSCSVDLPGGGQVALAFSSSPIPVMQSFGIKAHVVDLGNEAVEAVEIDFAGADMNMGFNRQPLIVSGDGKYTGEAMIPVCTTGRMRWQTTLLIKTSRRQIAVPFLFEAPVK